MATLRLGQTVRHFSVSAQRSLVKAPIQLFGLEGRYAHAIYSAASKEKKLDVVEKELNSFQALLEKDKNLAQFVADPTLKKKDKLAVVSDVMKKQKYSALTVNLFDVLTHNGRLNKMSSIFRAYGKLMSAHRGEVICTVTTAKALDSGNMKDLKDALQGFLKAGQTLELELKVDPTIIGGMVVNIGDKYVDMSMSSKIKNFTGVIKEAV
ncbi:hypothetical protein ScPMuIL_012648 [Solemya velum]